MLINLCQYNFIYIYIYKGNVKKKYFNGICSKILNVQRKKVFES